MSRTMIDCEESRIGDVQFTWGNDGHYSYNYCPVCGELFDLRDTAIATYRIGSNSCSLLASSSEAAPTYLRCRHCSEEVEAYTRTYFYEDDEESGRGVEIVIFATNYYPHSDWYIGGSLFKGFNVYD